MKNRDIGAEILAGITEINEFKKGNIQLKVTEFSQSSFAGLPGTARLGTRQTQPTGVSSDAIKNSGATA